MKKFNKVNKSQKKSKFETNQDSILLIVCEGETEENYLYALYAKLRISPINIIKKSTLSPSLENFKKELTRLKKDDVFEEEICFVFDTENDSERIAFFKEASKICSSKFFISSSCFEVWLIMHFKELNYNQPVDADKRYKELQSIISSYAKAPSKQYFIENFIPNTHNAKINSSKCYKRAIKNDDFKTFSQLHLLIDLLEDFSKKST